MPLRLLKAIKFFLYVESVRRLCCVHRCIQSVPVYRETSANNFTCFLLFDFCLTNPILYELFVPIVFSQLPYWIRFETLLRRRSEQKVTLSTASQIAIRNRSGNVDPMHAGCTHQRNLMHDYSINRK